MGLIRNTIEKIKNRKKFGDTIGTNITGMKLMYVSSLVIYQHSNEIYIAKNRHGKTGEVSISEIIDFILKEYYKDDLKDELTCSACWNIPIKKELDEAIRKVLESHGVIDKANA